jgi:hypothetical protein
MWASWVGWKGPSGAVGVGVGAGGAGAGAVMEAGSGCSGGCWMTSLCWMRWRIPFGEGTGRAVRGRRTWRNRSGRMMGRSGHGDAEMRMLGNIALVVDLILAWFPGKMELGLVVLGAGGSLDGHDAGQDRRGCLLENQQSSRMSLDGRLRCPPIVGKYIAAR